MEMHKIPIHLEVQDKFVWDLTFRQALILFIGAGLAYLMATTDWSTHLNFVLCMVGGGISSVMTPLLAFVYVRKRSLDQWAIIALIFYSSPRLYTWHPLPTPKDDKQEILIETMEEDKEAW